MLLSIHRTARTTTITTMPTTDAPTNGDKQQSGPTAIYEMMAVFSSVSSVSEHDA